MVLLSSASPVPPRSVRWQLLRGVLFVVGLFAGLGTVVLVWSVGDYLLGRSDAAYGVPLWRRAAAVSVGVVLGLGVVVVQRRLRSWSGRPRWLVPVAGLVIVAALVPTVAIPAPVDASAGACIPLADAWQPVVTASRADLAYYADYYRTAALPTHPSKATLRTYLAQRERARQVPAFGHAERYYLWLAGGGGCVHRSRVALSGSAAGLGLGAAAVTLAVRRRRAQHGPTGGESA